MTDITQELDEILNKAIAVKVQNSVPLMPNSAKVVEVRLQYQEAVRQLILDWHNKQVEEVLDRVESKATEYYDWSKSLEKEVERPFMAVPLERIEKLRSEL